MLPPFALGTAKNPFSLSLELLAPEVEPVLFLRIKAGVLTKEKSKVIVLYVKIKKIKLKFYKQEK